MRDKILLEVLKHLLTRITDQEIIVEVGDFILDRIEDKDPEPDPLCALARSIFHIPDNDDPKTV